MKRNFVVGLLGGLLSVVIVMMLLGVSGTAQAAPTATIQSMIEAAPDGGTVNIAAGTYTESLTVSKTLTLTGVSSATTTIVAVTGQRVITVTAGHNLRLENLTVTGGQASGSAGGGVYLADGSLMIINCRIANNSADYGGGVFQTGANKRLDVIGSRIEFNTTVNHGGGLYVDGSAALTNTLVLSNSAGWHGGGLHVQNGRTDLNGGLFSNNRALGDNGGAVNVNSSINITGTHFISNTAIDSGGALVQWNAGYTATLINARFERNSTKIKGGGAYIAGPALISNSNIVSNTTDSGGSGDALGGGLYLSGTSQIFTTSFVGNSVLCAGVSCGVVNGGGLYIKGPSAALAQVAFISNEAGRMGGGLMSSGSDLTLNGGIFSGNKAGWGGGMYHFGGQLVLTNALFSGNLAGWGGGLGNEGGTATLTHVTFGGNRASNIGGGLDNYASNPTLVNCILWGNSAPNGPQIGNEYGSTPAITYSNIQGTSVYTGVGNINADPQFIAPVAATAAPTTTGNYHLSPGSPASNAGTNASVLIDIDGEPRDAAPDMGADELRTCWARLNTDATDYGHAQAAVDASTHPTDVVKIAGYCPGVLLRAGLNQAVILSKTLTLRGGYTATDWLTSNPIAYPTVLDARQGGRVIYVSGSNTAALENLIIRGGLINGGGGVYNNGAQVTLANVIVRDNAVTNGYGGGGLCVASSGTLTVTASLVTSNTASYGGGIFNSSGKLMLINTTLSGNHSATSDPTLDGGGALDQWGAAPSAAIINSTIVSNTAAITNVARSGIWLENGTLTIQNSIVAHNGVTNNLRIENGAVFTSTGYNLTNSNVGTPFTTTTDLRNTNPLLGPLQDNGGSTSTHAFLPGSPAIDRIPSGVNGCGVTITTDQRGQPRPGTFTHLCDIGAYEARGIHYQVYLPVVIK